MEIVNELSAISAMLAANPNDIRIDGALQNALLSFGGDTNIDVEAYNQVGTDCRLTKEQQEDLFADDALVERVCTLTVKRMAGSGWVCGHPKNEKIQEWARSTGLIDHFRTASILANIYDRGAGIVLDVSDGQSWDKPVDRSKIKTVRALETKDGYELQPIWFGLTRPSYYQLVVGGDAIAEFGSSGSDVPADWRKGFTTQIHPDRVLWFPGIWIPIRAERRRQGSPSLLSRFWKHYSRYELAQKLAVNLISRLSIVNYKQKGWLKLLAQNDSKSIDEIRRRLEILKTMTSMGLLMSDMEDNAVEIISRSVAEVANILDRTEKSMIAASGLSKIDLFGFAEGGGLSSDDIRDRMFQADRVLNEQNTYWLPALTKIIGYWFDANGGDGDKKWPITFNSTLTYTRSESTNELNTIAQVLVQSLTVGAISANELRHCLNDSSLLAGKFPGNVEVAPTSLEPSDQIWG